jgi:hypothetical protein
MLGELQTHGGDSFSLMGNLNGIKSLTSSVSLISIQSKLPFLMRDLINPPYNFYQDKLICRFHPLIIITWTNNVGRRN